METSSRLHSESARTEAMPGGILADEVSHASCMKSRGGLRRLVAATRYSLLGLRAAWKHEAAFRQEIILGLALLCVTPWLAPSLMFGVMMVASILLVWCVEMINSAIEALADAISSDFHPLVGRAKDMGSAAVLFSIFIAAIVWIAALWVKFLA